jgi:hypothetical protein
MRLFLAVTLTGMTLFLAGCGTGRETESTTSNGTASSSSSGSSSETESGPTASAFSVTIENTTAASVFVHAGPLLPYSLWQGDDAFDLYTDCSCTACGSGVTCTTSDYLSAVVEIPPGDSIAIEGDLSFFVPEAVTQDTCPEAYGAETCDQPNALADGEYEIVVEFDFEQAVTDQGLTLSGSKQWGHPVWTGYAFASVNLSKSVKQSFTQGAGMTTITLQAGN